MKYRLDEILFLKRIVDSRIKAQKLILDGKVLVNGQTIFKPSKKFPLEVNVEITKELEFVSRGGLKLQKAIEEFSKYGLEVKDKICLDIGASTGGFTDCLLKNQAKLIIAIDNGKNQLHPSLQKNPQVISIEKFNAKNIHKLFQDSTPPQINETEIITMDVSFISATLITQSISLIQNTKPIHLVILIKPNFELEKSEVRFLRKGLLKDNKKIIEVLLRTLRKIRQQGFKFVKVIKSPIKGDKGNTEFLAYFIKIPYG